MQQPSILGPPSPPEEVRKVAWNDDIRSVAETVLNSALTSAEYGGAGEKTTYGNLAGRTLLEERYEMKEMMKEMRTKQKEMMTEWKEMKTQITDLRHRVKTLTQTSEGYRKIRHRFLQVYRRDILMEIDRQGLEIIGEGNVAAHDGDAVADASLFNPGKQYYERILVDLYGLTASQILYLGKCRTSLSKFT
jgi:hypothetical protein